MSKEIAASSRPSPAAVPVQPSAPVSTPDVLRLDGVEVVPEATQAPSWILRQSQPFHARMNLELADATKLPFQEVDYTAVVKAKGLGSNQIHTLAEEQGTLKPEARVTLNVKGTAIPPGVYHLFASVTLNPPAQPSSPKHLLKAFSKGSLLEIY